MYKYNGLFQNANLQPRPMNNNPMNNNNQQQQQQQQQRGGWGQNNNRGGNQMMGRNGPMGGSVRMRPQQVRISMVLCS